MQSGDPLEKPPVKAVWPLGLRRPLLNARTVYTNDCLASAVCEHVALQGHSQKKSRWWGLKRMKIPLIRYKAVPFTRHQPLYRDMFKAERRWGKRGAPLGKCSCSHQREV